VVDYFRRPKAGYQALQRSMQRVLPSIEYQIDDPAEPLVVHVVNDDLRAYPQARLRYTLVDAAGKRLDGGERAIDIAPDSVARALALGPHPEIAAGRARLDVWIDDATGVTLGRSRLEAADYVPRAKR
jgi:beta-mannosidase